MNMPNVDQIFGQMRPILSLVGVVLIIAALAKFGGLNVPINSVWWELGLAGWLCKQV
jgi:hypothetical protein